jgi:dipeptidyl aminopeptidase/acylaminoacyl peptidase
LLFLPRATAIPGEERLAAERFGSRRGRLDLIRGSLDTYLLFPLSYQKGKKYPLVVLPHGGPHAQDWSTFDHFAQFISTRGYIVAQPNFRGSTGYGKAFETAGYKQWGLSMQDDLTDVVKHLVKSGFADPQKVCIVGLSYGGYAALMGAVKTPELYRCSISINGVTHLREMAEYDAKEIDDERLTEKFIYSRMGHPEKDRAVMDANSPALLADRVGAPILVIAGEDDRIVPFGQAKMLVKNLKKHKKEYTFVRLDDGGHDPFAYWKHEEKVFAEVEAFLERYLGATKTQAAGETHL